MHYKLTAGDRAFNFVVYFFVVFVLAVTLYPLIYVFSMAVSDPVMAARGHVYFLPKGFSLSAIKMVLSDKTVPVYYLNTLFYTAAGTVLGVLVTCVAAYPLSRREFTHRNIFMKLIIVTMYFSGGMIPTYIVVTKYLGLYNSRWAIILPVLTNAWYIIVARSFFESLPNEIIESARIDGASEYRIFAQLVMPLSKPVLAVLALYFAVFHWNSYFPALLYLSKKNLQPLALYIRSVVVQSLVNSMDSFSGMQINASDMLSMMQIKYAVIVIAVLPMLLIYPFLSKNLEKGLMIGAVKG